MKKILKGFSTRLLILIGLLLIIAVCGYYVTWQEQMPIQNQQINQIAQWKTYTDPARTFTIQYPDTWNAGIFTLSSAQPVVFCPQNLANSDPAVVCKVKQSVGHIDTQAPIFLFKYSSANTPKNGGYITLGIDSSGNTYELYLGDQNYKPIFDQMVSSFKLE